MPYYTYLCGICQVEHTRLRDVATRDALLVCPKCGLAMKRAITAHAGYTVKGNNSASQRPAHAGSFKGGKK